MMGRKSEKLNIQKVKFTYSGTDNDLTLFLKTIIHDYLVENNIITDKTLKDINFTVNK